MLPDISRISRPIAMTALVPLPAAVGTFLRCAAHDFGQLCSIKWAAMRCHTDEASPQSQQPANGGQHIRFMEDCDTMHSMSALHRDAEKAVGVSHHTETAY
jgi:hypothetical protein